MAQRGKRNVTVGYLRTRFRWAKRLIDTALSDRLHDAGSQLLRRKRKTFVAPKHLPARVDYCRSVLRETQRTLDRWAYTDGTVFFLDRTDEENAQTQRAALGALVWRMADGSDALHNGCVGPSAYNKAQGHPVKVWGVLADGVLHITILDQGESMSKDLYCDLLENWFPSKIGNCEYLVSDFEGCLRCDEALSAVKSIGLTMVHGYPRVSQDFNAIENTWKLLRDRLAETLPLGVEARGDFVIRLKATVRWVNKFKSADFAYLSRNQKERAQDCLASSPPGARTKW